MKAWILFNTRFEYEHWGHGLADVIGACFDEEEAKHIADRMNAEYWRSHAKVFAEAHHYDLEHWPEAMRDGAIALSDDDLNDLCSRNDTHRVQVREVDLDALLELDGLDVVEKREALEGLAALLAPFNAGAAQVLKAEVER